MLKFDKVQKAANDTAKIDEYLSYLNSWNTFESGFFGFIRLDEKKAFSCVTGMGHKLMRLQREEI